MVSGLESSLRVSVGFRLLWICLWDLWIGMALQISGQEHSVAKPLTSATIAQCFGQLGFQGPGHE